MFSLPGAPASTPRVPLTLLPGGGRSTTRGPLTLLPGGGRTTPSKVVEDGRLQGLDGSSPRELRADAQAVLSRLGRLCPADRPWSGPSVDELDVITRDLELLQRRIAACVWDRDPDVLLDVIRARRCVDHALVLVLTALDGLRGAAWDGAA